MEYPISRYSTGDEELERVAFALRPGELSRILDSPEGIAVLKCVRHIPAKSEVKLEDVRGELLKEIQEKKVQLMIPEVFAELKKKAEPKVYLETKSAQADWVRSAEEALKQYAGEEEKKAKGPVKP